MMSGDKAVGGRRVCAERAERLATLAGIYEIDLAAGVQGIRPQRPLADYLGDPDSILRYVEVRMLVTDCDPEGPAGDEQVPAHLVLVPDDDKWWESDDMWEMHVSGVWVPAALVDLDAWKVLRRRRRDWCWSGLSD
jgi:hypothetical protein